MSHLVNITLLSETDGVTLSRLGCTFKEILKYLSTTSYAQRSLALKTMGNSVFNARPFGRMKDIPPCTRLWWAL